MSGVSGVLLRFLQVCAGVRDALLCRGADLGGQGGGLEFATAGDTKRGEPVSRFPFAGEDGEELEQEVEKGEELDGREVLLPPERPHGFVGRVGCDSVGELGQRAQHVLLLNGPQGRYVLGAGQIGAAQDADQERVGAQYARDALGNDTVPTGSGDQVVTRL
ncbi:hypothetical protein [Streptomyces sp. NPDC005301]|uniref:hypothetical protein n=1 Tax=Streptomyces sp. NPDC005301 TaxID=3156874 RepID=UPI0033B6D143